MPDLIHLLQSQDLGYMRIVAGLWGLDLKLQDVIADAPAVAAGMRDARLAGEIIESLDPPAQTAIRALTQAGGRMPWAAFERQFGDVREVGVGRRDRELPHLHPVSPAEILYYRALLGRAFFDTDKGPQEFAYIPDDLLPLLQTGRQEPAADRSALGRPATAPDRNHVIPASDRILDEATTLLAALRLDRPAPADAVLRGLLEAAGILQRGAPLASKVKAFLEMPRAEARRMLIEAWRNSNSFNELRLLPGLICEGAWVNRPREARQFILDRLRDIPPDKWWSLSAFVADIKQQHADFQRPAGDYDSWFIKSAADGSYLRGFASWDLVDGALVRFVLTDVMHRLGLLDLAAGGQQEAPPAFRIPSKQTSSSENARLNVNSQGRVAASRLVPRAVRYQLARFCQWEDEKAGDYQYRLTPRSLTKARAQGLKVEHLLTLLARHSEAGVPPVLVKALKRWETNGTEAQAEAQVVLKVSKPEILKALRKSKAAKYLGEALGPTTVIIKAGAVRKVEEAMAEMGLLMEARTDS